MVKLTQEIKEYIKKHKNDSNRQLSEDIGKKYEISISHVAIGNYKKTILETFQEKARSHIVENGYDKSEPILRTHRAIKKDASSFDFSLNTLKTLLDKNPDHIFHDYLENQICPKNGKAGKLRSDMQKLFDFIRDTT